MFNGLYFQYHALCFILLAFFTLQASAQDLQNLQGLILDSEISESKMWHKLLHFSKKSTIHKKSDFFLAKDGYKNPALEFNAFVQDALNEFAKSKKLTESKKQAEKHTPFKALDSENSESVICTFPARAKFLSDEILKFENLNAQMIDFAHFLSDFSKCDELNQFFRIVKFDEIFIEFAAESDMLPGSSMGHLYLLLQGVQKGDLSEDLGYTTLKRKNGEMVQYALSYYALLTPFFNPLDYANALFGNLNGSFALNPYENTADKYLSDEKRSIYRYKIHATLQSVEMFALHLWELKDKNIKYSFITHNCVDGLSAVLSLLDSENLEIAQPAKSHKKPFITPLEYLQILQTKGLINAQDMQFFSSTNKEKFTQNFGNNEILKNIKPTKIALSVDSDKSASLYFAPIYSDLRDVNPAYKEFIESRLGSVELGINFAKQDSENMNKEAQGGVFVKRIELLHLRSILDFPSTKSFSKIISATLESNLFNFQNLDSQKAKFSSAPNSQTRLFPTIEAGLGVGKYFGSSTAQGAIFAQILGGYRYEIINNAYSSFAFGSIGSFSRVRVLAQGAVYYDFVRNNRGYDANASLDISFLLGSGVQIFTQGAVYFNLADSQKYIIYERKSFENLKIGVSVNF